MQWLWSFFDFTIQYSGISDIISYYSITRVRNMLKNNLAFIIVPCWVALVLICGYEEVRNVWKSFKSRTETLGSKDDRRFPHKP